jgi:malonyl-CoA O-methyltransferase
MYNKRHQIEFEKYAKTYDSNANVQKKVAKELVGKLNFKPKKILDLGCGTGEVYKNISWKIDKFIGVDSSKTMCDIHPKEKNVELLCEDFESVGFFEKLKKYDNFDLIISSSSLQWSKDIKKVFELSRQLSKRVAFSIFTDGTFKTIYEITKRESFLPSYDTLVLDSKVFKNRRVEKKVFKIDFDETISMIRHIKMSGTGGGNSVLNYKEIKYLIENYPYKYLEFEVAYILN